MVKEWYFPKFEVWEKVSDLEETGQRWGDFLEGNGEEQEMDQTYGKKGRKLNSWERENFSRVQVKKSVVIRIIGEQTFPHKPPSTYNFRLTVLCGENVFVRYFCWRIFQISRQKG